DRVRVGAGSVVLRDVSTGCTVVGIPGRPISRKQDVSLSPLEHGKLPDIEATLICSLLQRVEQLERQLLSFSQNSNTEKVRKELAKKF
ncbi:MAG: serine O-acetyltransferase, partial [Cyanobacteria bacterium P01_H01_bin.150]